MLIHRTPSTRVLMVLMCLTCLPQATLAARKPAAVAARGQAGAEADAIAGEPFGVGYVTVPAADAFAPEPLGIDGIGIREEAGRVLYPALKSPAAGRLIREFLNENTPLTSGGPIREEVGGILRGIINRPQKTVIFFLFRGTAPLEITLEGRQSLSLTLPVRANPGQHRRLMQAWWNDYVAPRQMLEQKPDYPPQLETYLINTLARRLNLRLPRAKQEESPYAQFEQELGVFVGTESILTAIAQNRLLDVNDYDQPVDQPLPAALQPPPLEVPTPPGEVKVEAIARHVPAEFFYLRFGSFDNFLWFQDTLDTWGGDFQNLVSMRGLDEGRGARIQNQLVLKQSQLARLLGGTVISDVAMVGADMLFGDGAAFGILFEARNNMLFGNDIRGQRAERVKKGDVTEAKLTIEGQEVSYLSSPEGTVRSYYAVSGDYHFVTTSKALAARFLQTAKGDGSLGASPEFKHARTELPLDRGDAVFAYFSDAFFRNITGPQYRTGMMRRLEAKVDIEILQLAKLNAATEGKPGGTIDELKASGILPRGFGPRPDGGCAAIGKGEIHDTQQGYRGTFLPVPDMPIERITRSEAASYARFAESYVKNWGRIEPLLAAVQRKRLEGKREQVTIDLRMTPLARQRVEFFAKWAGPADRQRLSPIPGDLASFEAVLRTQRLLGGIRDVLPPMNIIDGRFMPFRVLRESVIGYLGCQGEPGLLRVLNVMFVGRPPDANGFSHSALGLWRLVFGPYTLFSFQQEVLAAVAPQLKSEAAERAAQLRLHVGDVSHAGITPFVNNWGYARTRETSLGNLRLIHSLEQQLHVPTKDSREAAEFLLGARLVCPLGGELVLRQSPGAPSRWTSTRIEGTEAQPLLHPQAPAGYVAPPLNWFRGLELDAATIGSLVTAHAVVIMQLPSGK